MTSLKLLNDDVPVSETPAQHIRNAIQALMLAEDRVQALTIPADPMLTELIRGAEARCFKALFDLGREEVSNG
ncbi:MAG: hypothetical protein DMD33_17885 [Gemmatimonadetes bacterium]|nr:MAG: hypothetical protein DMD33_17885 [Gemmatimonadota bacterium]